MILRASILSIFTAISISAAAQATKAVPFLYKDGTYTLVTAGTLAPLSTEHYQRLSCYDTAIFLAQKNSGAHLYLNAAGEPLFSRSFSGEPSDFAGGVALLSAPEGTTILLPDGHISALSFEVMKGTAGEGLIGAREGAQYGFAALSNGQMAIPAQYSAVRKFSEGVAAVMHADGRWSLISKTGKAVSNNQYDDLGVASEGLIPARTGRLYGYINKKGTLAIPARYTRVNAFAGGFATVEQDGNWQIISSTGQVVVKDLKAEAAMAFGSEGLAPVMRAGRWGFVNRSGETVIAPAYMLTSGFHGGLALVGDAQGRQFYIDATGKEYREQ